MSRVPASASLASTLIATLAMASMPVGCSSDDNSDETPETTPTTTPGPEPSTPNPENDTPAAPNPIAALETVQSGFGFTEGPAVDKEGNVFFTDQPNDTIFKWTATTGEISTFLEGTGRANGMAFDKDGYLIACADMHGELWRIAPDGSHEVLVDNYDGKLLNGPNDVWINPVTGGMYITDPMFPRDYWEDTDPRRQDWPPMRSEQAESGKGGHVYYLAPGASELVRVTTMPEWDADTWPNGVVGTADGTTLYVNRWSPDSLGGTLAFDIGADGTLSNLTQFVEAGGDGMSIDAQGNVYISNSLGVEVFSADGSAVLTIETGSGDKTGATNNVFAGSDQMTLFITGPSDSVATVQMNIGGVEKF